MATKETATAAQPRTARTLAEFVNLTRQGAAIFGRISTQSKNGNGPFVVFEPAAYRPDADTPFAKFAQLATGLSTDLASKVSEEDTGRFILFYLAGFKPTSKTPMKMFNVVDITTDQAGEMFRTNRVREEWTTAPKLDDAKSNGSTRAEPDPF